MSPRAASFAVSVAVLAACAAPVPTLPEGQGRGLLSADDAPPPGATTWERPTWRVGDRFELVRGARLKGSFEVVGVDEHGYAIDVGEGRLLRRDLDLGNVGEWQGLDGEAIRIMSPPDVRYHWPLWIGKRWQCEFADRVRGGQALPMQASYVVEGLDRVRVAAGEFEALRIVRTLRLAVPGDWMERTQIVWYAPDAGLEVRQLLGDTMVELESSEPGTSASPPSDG